MEVIMSGGNCFQRGAMVLIPWKIKKNGRNILQYVSGIISLCILRPIKGSISLMGVPSRKWNNSFQFQAYITTFISHYVVITELGLGSNSSEF